MTGSDFIIAQLALRAWQDGKENGINGMLAVAFTIKNRVKAGWYDGDWIEVLSNHKKWSHKLEPYSSQLPNPNNFAFRSLLQEVSGIFSGARRDDILMATESVLSVAPPPALYYGVLEEIDNPWFLDNISRSIDHRRIAQVGTLFFWT